jgi:hypothetical protein
MEENIIAYVCATAEAFRDSAAQSSLIAKRKLKKR